MEFCFNPRAHVGRDGALGAHRFLSVVSIHAPTWGATDGDSDTNDNF